MFMSDACARRVKCGIAVRLNPEIHNNIRNEQILLIQIEIETDEREK